MVSKQCFFPMFMIKGSLCVHPSNSSNLHLIAISATSRLAESISLMRHNTADKIFELWNAMQTFIFVWVRCRYLIRTRFLGLSGYGRSSAMDVLKSKERDRDNHKQRWSILHSLKVVPNSSTLCVGPKICCSLGNLSIESSTVNVRMLRAKIFEKASNLYP